MVEAAETFQKHLVNIENGDFFEGDKMILKKIASHCLSILN